MVNQLIVCTIGFCVDCCQVVGKPKIGTTVDIPVVVVVEGTGTRHFDLARTMEGRRRFGFECQDPEQLGWNPCCLVASGDFPTSSVAFVATVMIAFDVVVVVEEALVEVVVVAAGVTSSHPNQTCHPKTDCCGPYQQPQKVGMFGLEDEDM